MLDKRCQEQIIKSHQQSPLTASPLCLYVSVLQDRVPTPRLDILEQKSRNPLGLPLGRRRYLLICLVLMGFLTAFPTGMSLSAVEVVRTYISLFSHSSHTISVQGNLSLLSHRCFALVIHSDLTQGTATWLCSISWVPPASFVRVQCFSRPLHIHTNVALYLLLLPEGHLLWCPLFHLCSFQTGWQCAAMVRHWLFSVRESHRVSSD